MKGLIIKDELRWHDRWSEQIGMGLRVQDSTNDMYIFDDSHSREDILQVLKGVPEDLYQILDLTEAPEEDCDFMADSGQCYRRLQ